MFIQDWTVVAEADREQWDYTPFVHGGPLRYGMTHAEAVAAMRGFVSEQPGMRPCHAGATYDCVELRAESVPSGQHAVRLRTS